MTKRLPQMLSCVGVGVLLKYTDYTNLDFCDVIVMIEFRTELFSP